MKNVRDIISGTEGESAREKERILRAAWLVSLSAPISTAIAHYFGRTSILLADFLRRSNEFLALFLAWYIFIRIREHELESEDESGGVRRLELFSSVFMAGVMIISGLIILRSAWNQFISPESPGWLVPGLLINGGGLVVNGFFWYKNYSLHRRDGSQIMANQWRFYRAKTAVDFMVLSSLLITNFDLLGPFSWLSDPLGSLLVALFIWFSAWRILREAL